MVFCAVYGCSHLSLRDKDKIKFFRFPTVPQNCPPGRKELISIRRTLWLLRICRQDLDDEKVTRCDARVCSSHFLSGAPAILEDSDNVDWAPSQNLGHDFFDGERKLRKRNDKSSKKCPCLCDASDGHKKHKRETDCSKKNVISDNKTSSINTTAVSMKSIQGERSMSSSEATMSSSESRTSYTSKFSTLMKKHPRKSRYCQFKGCKHTSDFIGLHFYRFPKDEKRCRAWVKASKNEKLIGISASELYKNARLCNYHFQDWCFVNSTSKHRLVHNAIPCCTKSEATKKIGSAKVSNSTDSTVTNGADNNSSVLKQLLISPVSSQASSTVSEDLSSDSQEIPLMHTESGNSTVLRSNTPEDAHMKTTQSEDVLSTTALDSSSDSEDIPGNSMILEYSPPESAHIRTIQSDGGSSTIVGQERITSVDFSSSRDLSENTPSTPITSEESHLTTIESEDHSTDVNNLENLQKNNLPENVNHIELVQSAYINSSSEPNNSCESEHINCVTHTEAFNAAKTLLHYLMNQNDVDNPDINFLLNLTRRIKMRLPVRKETMSENS